MNGVLDVKARCPGKTKELFEAAVGGVLVAFSQMAPPAVARAIYDAAPSVTPGPPATPTA